MFNSKTLRVATIATMFAAAFVAAACGARDNGLTSPLAAADSSIKKSVILSVVPVGYDSARLTWTMKDTTVKPSAVRVYRDGAILGVTTAAFFMDTTIDENEDYVYSVSGLNAKNQEIVHSEAVMLTIDDNPATGDSSSVRRIQTTPFVPKIKLMPTSAVITLGDSMHLAAIVTDSATGVLVDTATVSWASSNAGIVSPSGAWMRGLAVGQVTVTASVGSAAANATVIVMPKATVTDTVASSVTVYPNPLSLPVLGQAQAQAIIQTNSGAVLNGRTITWVSSNPLVATVSASGAITGIIPGTATITATNGSLSGSVVVTISAVAQQPSTPSTPVVISVAVTPATPGLTVGATVQLSAAPHDILGALLGASVTWTSSNSAVATVSATGVVTAVAPGTVTIIATAGGISGTATLTVSAVSAPVPPTVVSVSLTPATVSINVGATTQLAATPFDILGTILSNIVTFSSSNTAIATVSANGTVTGVSAGTVTITATVGGVSTTATITVNATQVVTPPTPIAATVTMTPTTISLASGFTQQILAVVRDASNAIMIGAPVTWTSSNNAVATVSVNGLVTAVGAGTATITATSGSVNATTTVTISAPAPTPVVTINIATSAPSINVGATAQVTASPLDLIGNLLSNLITFSSSNTSIASVSANGLVTGVAPGTVTITATAGGISAHVNITITALPVVVASVSVTPAINTVTVGGTAQLTATPRDAGGNPMSGTATWSSSNTSVVTVSSTGLVTAVGAGAATVTATVGSITGTAVFTTTPVIPASISTITVTPSTASLTTAATQQLTAVARDINNNILSGRVMVWTSSNPAVATVVNGFVTALLPGTTTITVSSEGVLAAATITVTAPAPAAVASVTIGNSGSLCVAGSLQLTATARDGQGNILTGRAVVWTSSNLSVATISGTGLAAGIALGNTTITATIDGVSTTVNLNLCAPVTASVRINGVSGPLSLLSGLLLPLTAQALDANGNVIANRPITWSVNSNLALISQLGLLTPLLTGTVTVTATIDGVSTSVNVSITL